MSILPPVLWDFAGFDGLAFARDLFGPEASELAAYQSLDAEQQGTPCALLRLCENNFRVGFYGEPAAWEEGLTAAVRRRVWVKPTGLASLALCGGAAWEHLVQVATIKAPHRLEGLGRDRAVPARIGGHAALIWRHSVAGFPTVEVQTAPMESEAVRQFLERSRP